MTARCALYMGALKIFGSHYAHGYAKFEFRSFTPSWDNRGYPKKLGSPWIRPRSLFSKIFNGILFGWTLWMYWPNWKPVAFPVPEIIGDTRKMGSPWIRSRSLFSKIFNGILFGWTLWTSWPNLKSVPAVSCLQYSLFQFPLLNSRTTLNTCFCVHGLPACYWIMNEWMNEHYRTLTACIDIFSIIYACLIITWCDWTG